MTHYEMLGVSREATQDEIDSAFEERKRAGTSKQVYKAYWWLRDPGRRSEYDQLLLLQQAPPGDGHSAKIETESTRHDGVPGRTETQHRHLRDEEAKGRKQAFQIVGVVFAGGVLFLLVAQILPLIFPGSAWAYVLAYSADSKDVHITPMPSDCDFLYAPLGSKGCHYEKSVQVTLYSKDVHSGQPIVSYDNGKSWDRLPAGQNPGRTEVYVDWDRRLAVS